MKIHPRVFFWHKLGGFAGVFLHFAGVFGAFGRLVHFRVFFRTFMGFFLVHFRGFQVRIWRFSGHFVRFLSDVFWAALRTNCPQEVAVLGVEI